MSALQALLLALIQGVTELFPVSSLGHAVLAPAVLHWSINEADPDFLPFLVALHLGTSLALLLYFWRDWVGFAGAVVGRGDAAARDQRLLFLLIGGSIPAAVIGVAFEHILREVFATPTIAAIFLVVNGLILFAVERLRHKRPMKTLETATFTDAVVIGLTQALALIPGISRSGITIVGGLTRGLTHAEAARFSFLLATPIIAGAALLELPKLLHHGAIRMPLWLIGASAMVAGVTAYLSTAFLMRYFRRHESEALTPYAAYCVLAGIVSLIALR
jgi:undecaprenyl-diphosphatase